VLNVFRLLTDGVRTYLRNSMRRPCSSRAACRKNGIPVSKRTCQEPVTSYSYSYCLLVLFPRVKDVVFLDCIHRTERRLLESMHYCISEWIKACGTTPFGIAVNVVRTSGRNLEIGDCNDCNDCMRAAG
jgi:hypothetical protein